MQRVSTWQWATFEQLGNDQLYAALRLRQQVFVVEQECAYLDADGLDVTCHHLLGWSNADLAAYLRVIPAGVKRPEVVIGRVIVAPSWRGTGLGRELMRQAMTRIAEADPTQGIYLSGQEHLRTFYESLDFAVIGPGYLEDGIPHVPMRHTPAARR